MVFSTKKISAKGKAAPAKKVVQKPAKKPAAPSRSGGAKTTGGWLGSGSGEANLDKWYGERLPSLLYPTAGDSKRSSDTLRVRLYRSRVLPSDFESAACPREIWGQAANRDIPQSRSSAG